MPRLSNSEPMTPRAEPSTRRAPLPPFQALLEEHRSRVLGFLIATVGPGDADDCFQETFLAALRSYPSLRDARNLRGWLMTIAHSKAIDALRERSRRPAPAPEAGPDRGAGDASIERLADGTPELWLAAAALPPRQRAAVAHRFLADLPYRDIGAILDCSEAAARRSVHDGLDRLRKELVG